MIHQQTNQGMKAIKIDTKKREVYEVDIQGRDIKTIHKELECDCFTQVGQALDNGDTLLVDDEGLLKDVWGLFIIGQYPQPLAGHGLLIGVDDEGETVPVKSTVEQIRKLVQFV